MADRNLSGPIPDGWEIKTEVQRAGSETSVNKHLNP